MMPKLFRRFFRMYDDTLKSIMSYLAVNEPHATLLAKGKVPKAKKVAMTCAYLGSKHTISQLVHFVINDKILMFLHT